MNKRYFTGKPCKYGHICERLVSNRCCLECSKLRYKIWCLANPEKVRVLDNKRHERDRVKRNAKQREYAALNRLKANERSRLWAENNREKALTRQNRWNQKNKHKINAYAANRRCLILGRGKHSGQDIKNIYEKQNGICISCPEILVKWHVDHIQPISKGGSNEKSNLQLLCKRCNLKKGAKQMEEFLKIARIFNG